MLLGDLNHETRGFQEIKAGNLASAWKMHIFSAFRAHFAMILPLDLGNPPEGRSTCMRGNWDVSLIFVKGKLRMWKCNTQL